MAARRSLGGTAVEDSLEMLGFAPRPQVALVETTRPSRHPYETVMAQNAWNVIPWPMFTELISPYPLRMSSRMLARRRVAIVNLRRARSVVCLTHAMGDWCQSLGLERVVVSPVTVPVSHLEPSAGPSRGELGESFALVPGTITWYKEPERALEHLATGAVREVVFAGGADASGCRNRVQAVVRELGLRARFGVFPRPELIRLYKQAAVVVLPSALESLGFACAEALVYSENVVASPIPAHLEISFRLGVEPVWLGRDVPPEHLEARRRRDPDELRTEWLALGECLGLARRRADS